MTYQSRTICTLFLTLLLGLTTISSSTTGFYEKAIPVIDVKNLIKHYVLVCGHHLVCDPSHFEFLPTDTSQLINAGKCPDCSCDYKCVIYGNCCPDVHFMVPASRCKSTVLQYTSNHPLRTEASMIDTCGIFADNNLKNKCMRNYTMHELFENPPVTSTIYAHTFLNKYCAECNNVTDYKLWNLKIDCVEFADFNFLSSFSEIVDLAKQKDCLIEYEITADTYKPCELSSKGSPFFITACNTTGHWVNYIQDIALACENSNYNMRYRHYKNIFCWICNPMPQTDVIDIISVCNITGTWDKYEKNLEDACHHQEYTSATSPFKNVYCYMCNKNNSRFGYFVDVNGNLTIKKHRDHIHYKITVNNYNTDFYRKLLNENWSSGLKNIRSKEIQKRIKIDNMTSLLMKDYSTEGVYRYCDKNLTSLIFLKIDCSCEPQCFFEEGGTCCVETALQYPVSCYSNLFLSGDNRQQYGFYKEYNYLMIDGYHYVGAENPITHRCENPSNIDIFSMIPALDQINDIMYRNFDCFVCNQPGFTVGDSLHHLHSLSFGLLDVEIYCHIDLNPDFHLILGDFLKLAIHYGCIVSVNPTDRQAYSVLRSRTHCEMTKTLHITKKCNVSGHWYDFDPDLQEACEQSGPFLPVYKQNYKNVFCFLCNPPAPTHSKDTIPKTCNVSGVRITNEKMLEACETFPFIQHKLPFKNIFCEQCQLNMFILPVNVRQNIVAGEHVRPQEENAASQPEFRSLFGPWNRQTTSNSKTLTISVINTSNAEKFDTSTMTHRNVTCYPGKRLISGSCIPLLTTTNNLRYLFAIALDGEIGSNISLWDLLRYFKNLLKDDAFVIFESFYLVADLPCYLYNADSNGTSTHLLLHTTFKVVSYVVRLDFEERLLNMSTMNYTINGYTLSASIDQRAYLVPSMIHQINYDKNCFVSGLKNLRYISKNNYRSTIVSNLMLCPQIELDVHEFDADDTTFELTVKESKTDLGFGEFFITTSSKARICVEDFLRIRSEFSNGLMNSLKSNNENEALEVTTLVCTILSLTCLLLTFVTYVFFKSLRSVPGINNMCLVFSMFFAIALFLFGFQQTRMAIACEIIGVLSHFFWLSTFNCMSVCSFHMYRIFTNLSHSSGSSRKTVLRYMIYAYGTPVFMISVSITIIALTSNGESIGYGDAACFVSNKISFFLTFLTPVLIVCFTNIFFFVKTTLNIRSKPNIASNRENRNDFVIYVKLFSITGITWLLLILDTLFPLTAFSFIVTILNACQGLFIFVSFVFNKRVLSLYKNALMRRYDSVNSNITIETTRSSRSTKRNSSAL